MRKRSSERGIYIRRQAILLFFITLIIMLLIWLVQSVYELTPAGHTVLAEQQNSIPEYTAFAESQSSHSLAIWQGSVGKPFAVEAQGASLASSQVSSGASYKGIGKMLYCLQVSKEKTPKKSADDIKQQCEQQRKQDEQQQAIENKEAEEAVIDQKYAGRVYLTFDDGPSKLTAGVLDVLEEHNIKATFFVLGEKVEQYPQLAKRIVEEEHSIGNHSYNHKYDELYKSAQGFVDQVLKTTKAIYKNTGVVTTLFRAPGGTYSNFDSSYMKALQGAGYLVFDWNVDSGDSRSKNVTAKEIVANVKQSKLRDKVIVLMHDSSTHAATLEALPQIIAYYKEKNYQFVKISSNTEPLTSPLAPSIKWNRTVLTDKQAKKLKTETEELIKQAEKQK